jgi:hypothetical protein
MKASLASDLVHPFCLFDDKYHELYAKMIFLKTTLVFYFLR